MKVTLRDALTFLWKIGCDETTQGYVVSFAPDACFIPFQRSDVSQVTILATPQPPGPKARRLPPDLGGGQGLHRA